MQNPSFPSPVQEATQAAQQTAHDSVIPKEKITFPEARALSYFSIYGHHGEFEGQSCIGDS